MWHERYDALWAEAYWRFFFVRFPCDWSEGLQGLAFVCMSLRVVQASLHYAWSFVVMCLVACCRVVSEKASDLLLSPSALSFARSHIALGVGEFPPMVCRGSLPLYVVKS